MTKQPSSWQIPWSRCEDIPAEAWSAREQAWLTYTGSLTARLRYVMNGNLQHRLRFQGLALPQEQEARLLVLPKQEKAWIREIDWLCDQQRAIIGRVVIPQRSLLGKGKQLREIGRRSLGDILFSDPNLKRGTIEIARSTTGWIRRSIFYFYGQPVLVYESFLAPIFTYEPNPKPRSVRARLAAYWRLMRFDRPIGIMLLLWPTLWALWIAARGIPRLPVLIIFICGVVLMRAAGCLVNDFADRKIDSYVKRTRARPLATGEVSVTEALLLFISLCLGAFVLVLCLNVLTIILAVMALLLAVLYPFLKCYIHVPQLGLGIAFAWSIPMAFAAQTGRIASVAWPLFAATVLWTIAYDTQYALADKVDDIRIGVKSTAILFGRYTRRMIVLLQVMALLMLIGIGYELALNGWYYAGVGGAAILMLYQWVLLRTDHPQRCLRAFCNNQWVGMLVFVGLLLAYH